MTERHLDRVLVEDVVLDIGDGVGALILYTGRQLRGAEIEVSRVGEDGKRVHTAIHERRLHGQTLFAGVYPDLPEGNYLIWTDDPDRPASCTIVGGQVTEVDWR